MSSNKLIQIIIERGHKVEEYEGHYVVYSYGKTEIIITIPKATYLIKSLVESIKKILNL